MNTERRKRRRLWLGVLVIAIACSGDTHVGCSPTLTCSLRPSRFAPPVMPDAGPNDCTKSDRPCTAASLSLGARHACVVTDAANAICWGDDSQSQRGPAMPLSEGTDAGLYRSQFSHVLDGVLEVTAGAEHTCALLETFAVMCWGNNGEGQVDVTLGQDTLELPALVGLPPATQLAAGAANTCARTEAGILCWGSNRYGQSGGDPTQLVAAPQLVPGSQDAQAVACGVRHCCLLRASQVACWGELIDANGDAYISPRAVPVDGLDGVLQVAAGAGHSCALRVDGVQCWGLNEDGQLGDGTTRASATPVVVPGVPPGAGFVAAGGGELDGHLTGHTCAVDNDGQVLCWGRNAEGQLGRVISADHLKPEAVQLYGEERDDKLNRISRVALGAFFGCALGSRGSVFCWGDDSYEQLGHDPMSEQMKRTPVAGEALRVQRFGRMR